MFLGIFDIFPYVIIISLGVIHKVRPANPGERGSPIIGLFLFIKEFYCLNRTDARMFFVDGSLAVSISLTPNLYAPQINSSD